MAADSSVIALVAVLALTACTPSRVQSPAIDEASATEPVAKAENAAEGGDDILAEFQAGTRRLPAGDGVSWIVGKAPGPCAPLPDARPEGFHVAYTWRPSGDVQAPLLPPRYAVGGEECEILWSLLHIGTPEIVCSRFAPAALDELYGHLRAIEPHTIRTRRIADEMSTIHRGGYGVAWHWPGHACEIFDAGDSEIVKEDVARFEELTAWLKGACVTYGHAECGGVR